MNSIPLFMAGSVALFAIGIYSFLVHPHLLKKLIALNISSAGVFLFFVTFAARGAEVDPVPHALVLTGIVISVSATAYGAALATKLFHRTGSDTLEENPDDD